MCIRDRSLSRPRANIHRFLAAQGPFKNPLIFGTPQNRPRGVSQSPPGLPRAAKVPQIDEMPPPFGTSFSIIFSCFFGTLKTLILNYLIALFEGSGIPKTTILGNLFGNIFCSISKPSSGCLFGPLCPPRCRSIRLMSILRDFGKPLGAPRAARKVQTGRA